MATVSEQEPLQVISLSVSMVDSKEPAEIVTKLKCGLQEFHFFKVKFPALPDEIKELVDSELIQKNDGVFKPTSKALEFFRIVAVKEEIPGYYIKKIECIDCSLHFTILTWYLHKHKNGNLYCPECGQNSGRFYISVQREAGFIFQNVPGNATTYFED